MSSQSSGSAAFPLFGILGIVFVTLKLIGEIDWSWWWVLAPFWGPFVAFVLLVALGASIVFARHRKKRKQTKARQPEQYTDPFADPFFKNTI